MSHKFFSLFLLCILQWEYQVGPSVGIEAGDHIWASRYILEVIHFAYLSVYTHTVGLFNTKVKFLKEPIHKECHSTLILWVFLVQYNVKGFSFCVVLVHVLVNFKKWLFALSLIHYHYLCAYLKIAPYACSYALFSMNSYCP